MGGFDVLSHVFVTALFAGESPSTSPTGRFGPVPKEFAWALDPAWTIGRRENSFNTPMYTARYII
jgi:hypothetical protein